MTENTNSCGIRLSDDSCIDLKFDERGLIPAVVQDATTGEVLMVAWMNAEALRLTRKTGEAHFWSRSRRTLWHKGETSGNVQRVREILVDCDADTLLLKVDPAGPACHTGERSCFYRRSVAPAAAPAVVGVEAPAAAQVSATLEDGRAMSTRDILEELFDVILDRQAHPEPGSYTVHLLESGEDEVLKKVGEEAMEVILAGKGQSDERLIAEVADLFYHLLVLFAARGVTLDDVKTELERRRK